MTDAIRPQRLASSVLSDVAEATIKLECLPSLIQATIEAYDLDNIRPTEAELQEYTKSRKAIFDLLTLTRQVIFETCESLENIPTTEEGVQHDIL